MKTAEQHAKDWIESHIYKSGKTCFDADLMKFQSSLATWFMSAQQEAYRAGQAAMQGKAIEVVERYNIPNTLKDMRALPEADMPQTGEVV